MTLLERLINNHVLANILFVLVLILGTVSYLQLPRAAEPDINFNWINIITALPGASSIEVERRITDPLEDVISSNIRDIRFVTSTSRDGISNILLRFNELDEREFDKRITDLRREVQNVYTDKLPPEALDPNVMEITTSNSFPTAIVVLTSNNMNDDFRRYSTVLRKEFEQIGGIGEALLQGVEKPELHVAFDPARLSGLGITPADITETIRGYFNDRSIGDLTTSQGNWTLRLEGTTGTLEELESMPIIAANGVVSLGSFATVYRSTAEPQILTRFQGKPAVMFSLSKEEGANTLAIVESVRHYLAEENQQISKLGYKLVLVDDQTVTTNEAISLMQNNALIGLVMVVLVSWLFLGSRIALLTSIGIPFTLAGTFFIINATEMATLNNSVLLGAVIALGMLVDDAVVVVEAIYYRLQRGASAMQASLDSLAEVAAPVTTSVMTTIAVFLPLILLPGILGQFMKTVPIVVCLALLVSLIEAFWMLPAHISLMKLNLSKTSRSQDRRRRLTHKVRHLYSLFLLKTLRHPWRTLFTILAAMLLSASLVLSGAVKIIFFASDPLPIFYVNVETPPGTPLEKTLQTTLELETKTLALIQPEELRATTSFAGQAFSDTEPLFGDNFGQVMVSLNPQLDGYRTLTELIKQVEDNLGKTYGDARVSILLLNTSPVSQAISVKVRGDEFEEIQAVTDHLIAFMEREGYFRNINTDFRAGNPEVNIRLKGDAIKRANLSPDTVSRTLQAYVDGELVTSYQDKGEEVDVRVLADRPTTDRDRVDSLFDEVLYNPQGQAVALGELVDVNYVFGQQNIRHYNYLRTITLSADIDESVTNTVKANDAIRAYWETIKADHPRNSLDFSGELDDIFEALDAIVILFAAGLGLIYLILGTQFRSYWQPILVLTSIPLAFTGVVMGLYLTGNPLSLYTLYGVVALAGISVNSSIVLVSAANDRLEAGMSVLHATVYAARRRVIPILITSLTTIAGLFSLAVGFAGKSLIWGPIATAIVSGLVFSTCLTLVVIPLLYRTVQDMRWVRQWRIGE